MQTNQSNLTFSASSSGNGQTTWLIEVLTNRKERFSLTRNWMSQHEAAFTRWLQAAQVSENSGGPFPFYPPYFHVQQFIFSIIRYPIFIQKAVDTPVTSLGSRVSMGDGENLLCDRSHVGDVKLEIVSAVTHRRKPRRPAPTIRYAVVHHGAYGRATVARWLIALFLKGWVPVSSSITVEVPMRFLGSEKPEPFAYHLKRSTMAPYVLEAADDRCYRYDDIIRDQASRALFGSNE
ncbi:hypothetical protein EVAR_3484_1 [Eumeta japonica]|uniref:Uncharacterized protein n=1 Tax=Eumeta variegata TaxID=151549 RepID=A0A4C1SVE0_EUMVA|nr:hypothetical protein EVAR_3484_1 [Eumeta japonica]